jgi:hypothetical protein
MADTVITLQKVICDSTSEAGKDEVYLKYSEDGGREQRFPDKGYTSMGPGSEWSTQIRLSFKTSVLVSLFDNDGIGDDFLGSHTYIPSSPQPETVLVSNPNGAKYRLDTVPG